MYKKDTQICLIIVNYNGMSFLPLYLKQVFLICKKYGIDLLITDDKSTDDSVKFLLDNEYTVTVNKGNTHGFAANVNNGIRYAASIKNYDYYFISNNDIEYSEYFLPLLIKSISNVSEIYSKWGLIGVTEVNPIDKIAYFNFDFINYSTSNFKFVNEIPGFFFVVNQELIEQIGLMDEDYFMYGEDNDYYFRCKKAGFTILSFPIPLMHMSEGSSISSKQTSWYVYRNALLVSQKNFGLGAMFYTFIKFVFIIYNPFYNNTSPSAIRVKRNGFLMNNKFLINSLIWNLKYYYKNI